MKHHRNEARAEAAAVHAAPGSDRRATWMFAAACAIFFAVVGHQQMHLRTELLDPAPYFNDNVLHLSLTHAAADALLPGA